jgi:SpoVK/Ycf46/Vps4 family AAA+-type ATPase
MAAEALAAARGRRYIDVSYAELESKYVSQTSKNIVECFRQAAAHDAVLVFNEADSILGARLSEVTQSADHSVNIARSVMLTQLDHFTGLVIFTTNFARNYDNAFVRRILTHVRLDLPDTATRRRLWERFLPAAMPGVTDLNGDALDELAAASEQLAGGHLVNIVIAAAGRVAERTGTERRLQLRDLQEEIQIARRTQQDVGRPNSEPARVVDVQQLEGLPADVKG